MRVHYFKLAQFKLVKGSHSMSCEHNILNSLILSMILVSVNLCVDPNLQSDSEKDQCFSSFVN